MTGPKLRSGGCLRRGAARRPRPPQLARPVPASQQGMRGGRALTRARRAQTALGVAGMPYTTHPVPRPVLRQAGHMGSFLQASSLAAVMVTGDQPYVSTAGAAIGVLGPGGVSVPAGPLVGLASHAVRLGSSRREDILRVAAEGGGC